MLALAAHVAQQALASANHLEQPLARGEVMDVVLQVAAETVDPLTQHGHLDLGRTGVGAVGLVGVDQLLLLGGIERHTCSTSIQFITIPCGPSDIGIEKSSLTSKSALVEPLLRVTT